MGGNYNKSLKILGALPLFYFFIFLALPIGFLTAKFSVSNILTLAGKYHRLIIFNLAQAALSAFIATLFGTMLSYVLARRKIPELLYIPLSGISKISFIVPGVSMALGFFLLFGKSGLLNAILGVFGVKIDLLYTFPAVVLGHAFYNIPVSLYITGSTWENLDGSIIESAEVDGASSLKIFWKIEFPILLPSIIASFLLSFIYSFTSFAVVMTIGGPRYATLEVMIYMHLTTYQKFSSALALTFIQLFIVFTASYTASALSKKTIPLGTPKRSKAGVLSYLMLFIPALFVITPVILALASSFFYDGRPSLKSFENLFENGFYFIGESFSKVLFQTILIAASAAFIATSVSLISSHFTSKNSKIHYLISTSPSAFSTVTLAFGYLLVAWTVNLKEYFLIPFLHSLLAVPFTTLLLDNGWRSLPAYLNDAAKIDGAPVVARLVKIYLPLMKHHVVRAFLLSMAISMSDLAGVLILSGEEITTLSRAVYRLMSSRHMIEAQALNTIFLAIILLLYTTGEIYLRKHSST